MRGHTFNEPTSSHVANCLVVCMTKSLVPGVKIGNFICDEGVLNLSGIKGKSVELLVGSKDATAMMAPLDLFVNQHLESLKCVIMLESLV